MKRWQKRVSVRLAELGAVRQVLRAERKRTRELEREVAAYQKAQALAQQVAAQVQSHAHGKIARIVTRCLDAVFDDPYTFRIDFERRRGRTEARLVFERGGVEVSPVEAASLGAVDVAAFALRVACIKLSRPPLRPLLVLDEPFRFLHASLRPRVRQLVETVARDLKLQVIQVTHDEELRAGKLVTLR